MQVRQHPRPGLTGDDRDLEMTREVTHLPTWTDYNEERSQKADRELLEWARKLKKPNEK